MTDTQEQVEFWARAKTALKVKLEANDFAFLDGLLLNPRNTETMRGVLVFSVLQDSFPDIHGLGSYLTKNGYQPYRLANLRVAGFVSNRRRATGGNPGIWRLASTVFRNLLEMPEGIDEPVRGDVKRTRASKSRIVPRRSPESFRGKTQEILDYLNRERVGDRLVVTRELIEKVSSEVDTKTHYVTNVLGKFVKKGLVLRSSPGRGKPAELIFQDLQRKGAPAEKPQVDNLLEAITREIATLARQKEAAEARIREIEELLAKKTLVQGEIKRLAGISS